MEYNLVPPAKIIMHMRKRIAIGSIVITTILWVALLLCGSFEDNVNNLCVVSFMFVAFDILVLYPIVRYGKVSQSVVKFTAESIQFLDAKKRCWRTLPYNTISKIEKRMIRGTFYGEKKDEIEGEYLCFFLNGLEDIPDVSYSKLFIHRDFTMVYYQENLLEQMVAHGTELCVDDD